MPVIFGINFPVFSYFLFLSVLHGVLFFLCVFFTLSPEFCPGLHYSHFSWALYLILRVRLPSMYSSLQTPDPQMDVAQTFQAQCVRHYSLVHLTLIPVSSIVTVRDVKLSFWASFKVKSGHVKGFTESHIWEAPGATFSPDFFLLPRTPEAQQSLGVTGNESQAVRVENRRTKGAGYWWQCWDPESSLYCLHPGFCCVTKQELGTALEFLVLGWMLS